MPAELRQPDIRNHLLAGLSEGDFGLISPHLVAVELPLRHHLEAAGRPVKSIFFPEEGLASVVAVSRPSGRQAEVGLVGAEGMTGFSFIHGVERSPHDVFMQAGGNGYAIDADDLRTVLNLSRMLQSSFLRFSHVFHLQAAGAVLANATGTIEERLSRWLLMTHDRLPGDELRITHEFFSVMLGVRRPGITISLRRLESEGLILLRRGATIIVDRDGLLKRANGLYGAPEAEYERLFGAWRNRTSASQPIRVDVPPVDGRA